MEGFFKKINFWYASGLLALGFLLLVPSHAWAASLYFSPSSGKASVGGTVTVGVYVSSEDQAANAASGEISFPADKLSVASLSKSGSVFNLWVQEPSFSNSAGKISFEGVILNPGYTGSGGKILNIVFKAKAAGSAKIVLGNGVALANDGQGTNILKGLGSATLTINEPAPEVVVEKPPAAPSTVALPAAPAISSPSHPEQNRWYNSQQLEFSLEIPKGVTGMRKSFDQNSGSVPSGEAVAPSSKIIETASTDGVWYLHVQFANSAGWGPVATVRAQVDALAPERLKVALLENAVQEGIVSRFQVDAYDAGSGVDRYEVSVDGGDVLVWKDNGGHVLSLPRLAPGGHVLKIKVIDGMGHAIESAYPFTVKAAEVPDKPRTQGVSAIYLLLAVILSAIVSFLTGMLVTRRKRKLKKWLSRWH